MFVKIVFFLSVAVLQVSTESPIISSISRNQEASVGDDVEFNCTVQNVGTYSVGWGKNTNDQASSVMLSMRGILSLVDPRYNITESNSTYTFRINKIEASDMGFYECQVIISASDKVTKSVKLSVRHPPIISEEKTPKSVVVTEGENVEATCYADGYPEPKFSWKREDNSIMPAGGHVYNGATLHIRKTHRLDRGGYYCIANNDVGLPDERIVRIEVEFRPQISVVRPKVAQMKTHAAEMECSVQGYPPPAVFWFKDGSQLQSGGNYRITNMASSQETTNSVLRILSIAERDYGDYFCNATNKLGHADARLNLFQPVIPVPTV